MKESKNFSLPFCVVDWRLTTIARSEILKPYGASTFEGSEEEKVAIVKYYTTWEEAKTEATRLNK